MRREDHIDFHLVADSHLGIHQRLEAWARWVRVRPHGWQVQPMFRQFRSGWRQWHEPILRVPVNVPEAVEMEKAVSLLPEKERDAIRWCYVMCGNPEKMARRLSVSMNGLLELVARGRTMLSNRL